MKKIVFKNYLLQFLVTILDLSVEAKIARSRDRFLKSVYNRLEEIEIERKKILLSLAKKDDKGMPLIIERDGEKIYDLSPENLMEFQKQYMELLKEDFIVDILPSNQQDVATAKELVFNIERSFNIQEGKLYSEICESFEAI